MQPRLILTVAAVLGGLLAVSVQGAAVDSSTDSSNQEIPDKVLIIDGRVSHTVGDLHNHVTNFGLIGSWPTRAATFSHAPSARWPGADGINYLYAAGLWVGGTVLGERLVTTGQYDMEFRSTTAPGDSIFSTVQGAPQGTRFPWPGADDDGDGMEDEDPLDGLDNDLDGLIDEDFAAISDEHYRCVMADYLAELVEIYPDHTPLGLKIEQESFQWDVPVGGDFIGYEYRITNEGVIAIQGLHCGIFADFDIVEADDDMAGSWGGTNWLVRDPWGGFVPVSMGWMHDGAATGAAPGWVGFVMCGVETDAAAGPPADPLGLHSFQIFTGNSSYEQGGNPTNDSERYQSMHLVGRDPDTLPGMESDYRILMSTPEVTALAPGETVIFRTALVIGDSFEAMLGSAAEALRVAYGSYFDRDGDPANGDEFHVPWIRPDEVPVPAVTGHLQAALNRNIVSLVFDVRHTDGGWTEVERRETEGVPGRSWTVDQESGSILDEDAVGWPRIYDLKLKSAGGPDLVLDTVEVVGPSMMPLMLKASPNPFNPRLTIQYSLPVGGSARLEVIDLMGRVVQVLFDEFRPAGEDQAVWNGLDRRGQAAASGVYLVRLVTNEGFTEQRVTLLR
jgi:hypothetical protein